MRYLELLSPAKNADQGIAAINHGADAVYIGASSFGARTAAGNSVEDIERLVRHAHLYGSKVFATVNTLLFDSELEAANRLTHQLYNIGTDALIIQDLGLLETDLPPIALHASTQTHNISPERVKFLEQVGFKRVILARETSLEQMRTLREQTSVELEAFVQGALCVCYSGQCYMSQYLNERSGNRGCCGQPCRSTYDLYNEQGKLLRREEHLLSLKDFNASQYIGSMVDAGITSFKIEGRLKDVSYVKNVTAYYRQLLDSLMQGRSDCRPASDGKTTVLFTPDLEKTFNRDFTSYFLTDRQPMASMATQKSLGKKVGTVAAVDNNSVTLKTTAVFCAGDGLCYLNTDGKLEGFSINRAEGARLYPNHTPDNLAIGTTVWRNNDFAFEKQLQGETAQRKIDVTFSLQDTSDGFMLTITDADGHKAQWAKVCEKIVARDAQKAQEQIVKQLSKLGDTAFVLADEKNCRLPQEAYFLPVATINEMRRQVVAALVEERIKAHRPKDIATEKNDTPYYKSELDYRANIVNKLAEQFYSRHGVTKMEHGLELTHDYEGKALMTTKYCLRYELGQCLKGKSPAQIASNRGVDKAYCGNLYLRNNKNFFLLKCNCAECEMQIELCTDTPFSIGKESHFNGNNQEEQHGK